MGKECSAVAVALLLATVLSALSRILRLLAGSLAAALLLTGLLLTALLLLLLTGPLLTALRALVRILRILARRVLP